MKKSEKIVMFFCLLFFLTTLISFSQQTKGNKEVIPAPQDQGVIAIDDPFIDQFVPLSPVWESRNSRKYKGMVAGDYDSDGYHEIAFDFGGQGIWIYDPNASTKWNQISSDDPNWMIAIGIGGSDDEIFAEWDDANTVKNSWWNATGSTGYPGTWTHISNNPKADYAYDAGDVNGDGDSEVVVQWDGSGIYVCNYTGAGTYGGFDIYRISTTEAYGFTAQFAAADYELIHAFGDGTKMWNYSSGYPSTNWTTLNSATMDYADSLAADTDGGSTDELMLDIISQLWHFDYDTTTWTRYNYNSVCEMYAVAYGTADSMYEFYVRFCSVAGLWGFNPSWGTSGSRANWNEPDYLLGVDFRSSPTGDEVVADFGTLGVWYQTTYLGSWTRINWGNPQSMIRANLDADPEFEVVFDFGSDGVWVWDGATGTGTWTRISYSNPEAGASLGNE